MPLIDPSDSPTGYRNRTGWERRLELIIWQIMGDQPVDKIVSAVQVSISNMRDMGADPEVGESEAMRFVIYDLLGEYCG